MTIPTRASSSTARNLPKDYLRDDPIATDDIPVMDYQAIIAGTVGEDSTYGTVVGRVKACAVHLLRVSDRRLQRQDAGLRRRRRIDQRSAQDLRRLRRGEGAEPAEAAGHICENGFEHHVAVNLSQTADAVKEALSKYLGWDVYHHKG